MHARTCARICLLTGTRPLPRAHALSQLGVQRYDHVKHLWTRIQRVQELAIEYENMLSGPRPAPHSAPPIPPSHASLSTLVPPSSARPPCPAAAVRRCL